MKNYYDVLGVNRDASSNAIRTAFRKISKKFHPDVNNGDEFFSERFKEVKEAYEVLYNKDNKKDYDKELQNFLNRDVNVGIYLQEVEEKLKSKYDALLEQKEHEVKRRYWTKEQFEAERIELKRKKIAKRNKVLIFEINAQIAKHFARIKEISVEIESGEAVLNNLKGEVKIAANNLKKMKDSRLNEEGEIKKLENKILILKNMMLDASNIGGREEDKFKILDYVAIKAKSLEDNKMIILSILNFDLFGISNSDFRDLYPVLYQEVMHDEIGFSELTRMFELSRFSVNQMEEFVDSILR